MITDKEKKSLLSTTKKNICNAHAPYSNFPVSASVITKAGIIYTGVNIENSTYNLGLCAERVAIFKAISEGDKNIKAIAVYSPSSKLITICGPCRQIIYEFIKNGTVLSFNDTDIKEENIQELLPNGFDDNNLAIDNGI